MPRQPSPLPAHGPIPLTRPVANGPRGDALATRGFRGLQSSLLRRTAASVGLFLLFAFALSYTLVQDHTLHANRAALESLGEAVAGNVASATAARDPALLQSTLEGLARHPLVSRAEVLAADGRVLAAAARPGAVAGPWLPVRQPLPAAATAGAAQLVIQPDDLAMRRTARHDGLAMAGLVAGHALLVALLCHLAVVRGISRPIAALARTLRAITPGTDERLRRPRGHRHDEIGLLVEGANVLLDTTAQALGRERQLLADLAEIEARYRKIFESSSAGIFVLDPQGQLVASNPTVMRLAGLAGEALPGALGADFIDQVFADPRRVKEMIRLSRQRHEAASGDLELRRRGDTGRWVHCLVSVQDGDAGLIEGVMYDITDRKSVEHTAMYHSQHDALTGLKNRAGTLARLQRRTRTALAEQRALTLLVIDLDGFKAINDRHGHHAGDQVLVACAQRMRSVAGRGGPAVVGRLGGDEFMVILERLDPREPLFTVLCKTLLDALTEPITLDTGPVVAVSASIGVATLGRHGRDAQSLIEAADKAMYAVKASGKNNYALAWSGLPVAAPPPPRPADGLAAQPLFADSLPMESMLELSNGSALADSLTVH